MTKNKVKGSPKTRAKRGKQGKKARAHQGLSKMEKGDGKRKKKWGSDEEKVRKGKQVEERGQQARKQKKSRSKGRARGRKFGNQEGV